MKQFEYFQENFNAKLKTLEAANTLQLERLMHQLEALNSTNNLKLEQLVYRLKILDAKNDVEQQTEANMPRSCREVKERVYDVPTTHLIQPDFAADPIKVLCELKKRGGGWAYILNRFDGSQNFDFDLEEYKQGFGNLSSEFWLGLDNIHYLTGYEISELLVELVDWNGTSVFAHYDVFRVGSGHEGYLMTVSGYKGTAGDSLSNNNYSKFSTKTIDLDIWSLESCAQKHGASWWYKNCLKSLLTGKYLKGDVPLEQINKIMYWDTFRGAQYSLKEARMMVRPRIERND
ncbi:hypothetical protein Zmor_008373 [Zophobas morio]|uniref:Fibrinogen C-terminal domain-containing protein n=1 Tax=Zophobas morio TaxID=2755281 RepID=A0AA38J3Y3_9CUCU|nr:hypothetical protein Zmor_008373 [Zophobas morio]